MSVSFERGADIARETADVVLMNNNLLELLEAIAIARETRDLIEQNIAPGGGPQPGGPGAGLYGRAKPPGGNHDT